MPFSGCVTPSRCQLCAPEPMFPGAASRRPAETMPGAEVDGGDLGEERIVEERARVRVDPLEPVEAVVGVDRVLPDALRVRRHEAVDGGAGALAAVARPVAGEEDDAVAPEGADDVAGGGYAGVSVNIVVIVILGLAFGFLFLGLDRALSRGSKPTPL